MNLATLHEAIAQIIPNDDCIVWGEKRHSWQQTTARTRRLAHVLKQHGLGCYHERHELQNYESGQSHVALYLYNGNEYLEAMLGCYKARAVPFNVNYRYAKKELIYLLTNADTQAIIYHAAFAPLLQQIQIDLPQIKLWLQVQDHTHTPLLAGALDYEHALAQALPIEPVGLNQDDLYMVYTGGTTGTPKGVLWRQKDIYHGAMVLSRLAMGNTYKEVTQSILNRRAELSKKRLHTAPLMHAAAQWGVFNIWFRGGCIVFPLDTQHFNPDLIWYSIEKERVNELLMVGDAFARPLLEQLDKKPYNLSSIEFIASGGALFSETAKLAFRQKFPNAMIVDVIGASETGIQTGQFFFDKDQTSTAFFPKTPFTYIAKEDLSDFVIPGSDEIGWLAHTGYIPLGYYKDVTKTQTTFPTIQGTRCSLPGDKARYHDEFTIHFLGRDSATINTGGEKVFAEEVELALKHHAAVYDVTVVGIEDTHWGQKIVALVQLTQNYLSSNKDNLIKELIDTVAQQLAHYKIPKDFFFIDAILRNPNGKPDYPWAKDMALKFMATALNLTR